MTFDPDGLIQATHAIRSGDLAKRRGRVGDLIGLIIEATGIEAEIGERRHGPHLDRPDSARRDIELHIGRFDANT